MENYKQAASSGQDIIFKYIKARMKENKITQKQLAKVLEIGETTLIRYFKQTTPMPLGVYLEICGALKLRPYLIPSEDDSTEMNRLFFN